MFEYCDEKPLEGLKWDIECICEYGAAPIEVGVALLMTGVIWPPKDPPNPLADGGLGDVLVWYPLAVPSKEVFPTPYGELPRNPPVKFEDDEPVPAETTAEAAEFPVPGRTGVELEEGDTGLEGPM